MVVWSKQNGVLDGGANPPRSTKSTINLGIRGGR